MIKKFLMILFMLLVVWVPLSFAVAIDGEISPDEYSKADVFDKGNFKLLWEFSKDTVYMAIEAKTPGWISIGFDPGKMMSKCDMILAVVNDSQEIEIYDEWCRRMMGPHESDINLGGTEDLLSYAGSRHEDTVIIEFSRLLDTKDVYDKAIPTSGQFKINWAYGASNDMTKKHKNAGSAKILMEGKK
ncbi:MAG: DOMON domain-containing protein [Candidatus Marinimicrobia bacterium]|nr:DOMON domain-containing protein [Candidatus Neomarinimicrobiota bacterium]